MPGAPADNAEITVRVARGALPIVVIAGGELESSRSVDVVCEVQGQQNKIVEMLPEGTRVSKDHVVLQFDTGEVTRGVAEAKIKGMKAEALAKAETEELKIVQNKHDSEVAKAKLVLTLAELDKRKYEEGDYGVQLDDLKGSIALAEANYEEATSSLDYYDKLVKKGFRTPEQLRAKEQEVMRAQYFLSRDQSKLRVLEQYTRERQIVELAAKAEDAKLELARADSSRQAAVAKTRTDLQAARVAEQLEKGTLQRLEKQLEQCTVRAPQDGVVVYASGSNETSRIRLGAVVHFKQKLFSLPDLTHMRAKSYVHESVVQKVKPGLRAEIRIDAYPGGVLHGVVEDVASFYDPERQWASGGVKDYLTNVRIEDLPDVGLKPGMTADVRILVNNLSDVLTVPVQAVTEEDGQYYCQVLGPHGVTRREVAIGESSGTLVEIRNGLEEGELLALTRPTRAAAGPAPSPTKPARPAESPETATPAGTEAGATPSP